MARRTLKPEATDRPDWGDTSRAGTKVRIRHERGEYVVKYEAGPNDPGGEHVGLFGGPHQQFRTPAPDRVVWPRKRRGGAAT